MVDLPMDVIEIQQDDFYTRFWKSYDEWLEENAPLNQWLDVEYREQEDWEDIYEYWDEPSY